MSPKRKVEKNPLEWAVVAVGMAVVLATVGFLPGTRPPATARRRTCGSSSGARLPLRGFAVPVTVHNLGDVTAESVHVEVTLEIPAPRPSRPGSTSRSCPAARAGTGGSPSRAILPRPALRPGDRLRAAVSCGDEAMIGSALRDTQRSSRSSRPPTHRRSHPSGARRRLWRHRHQPALRAPRVLRRLAPRGGPHATCSASCR